MKGITPIISIIILLLITISLAGVAYLYLSGWLTTMTGKSFIVPPGGVYCSGGLVTATVTNTGQSDITTDDFIIHSVDTTEVVVPVAPATSGLQDITLARGEGGVLILDYNAGTGQHKVFIGTSSHVEEIPVNC